MAGTVGSDRALGRLLGMLYTEVFQKNPRNPNKPLDRSGHLREETPVIENVITHFKADSTTYIWGPGGVSSFTEAASVDSAARWGEVGVWA